jgi:hypothetical protein
LACRERFLFWRRIRATSEPVNDYDSSKAWSHSVVGRIYLSSWLRLLEKFGDRDQLNKLEPLERFELFQPSSDWFRTVDCGNHFQS